MKRKKEVMGEALFRKIVKDAVDFGVNQIQLQGYGEPLLDPDILKRIRYVKNLGPKVVMNTNASLLSENKARNLIENGLDEIFISLDAFSKENYEMIRPPLDYDSVRHNVDTLHSIRKSMNSASPRINLTFTIQDGNDNEADKFYRYWKDRCDNVIIAYARNWAERLDVSSRNSPHIHNLHRRNYNPCESLWKILYVQVDGRVALCCDDYEGTVILGNLNSSSLADVWMGDKSRAYRKAHFDKRRNMMPLCEKCCRHINWFNL
jgi:MoaA/NifB/PqqE/SkfB family radical SAM enzyme